MSFAWYKKTYHRQLLERILWRDRHHIHGAILDIGSKNRRYDDWFRGVVTAVDKEPNPEKNVVYGDVETKLSFADNTFDSVLCLEVVEYLDQYTRAFEEVYRVLKPGGYALVSVPFLFHDHEDKIRLTESQIKKAAARFSLVESHRIGNGYLVIWDILRKKMLRSKTIFGKCWFGVCVVSLRVLIALLRLHKKTDDFYSGTVVLLRK
mgnify:CR=1 FL=1